MPSVRDLIEPGTQLEIVAEGFTYTEGPVWDWANGRLLFHDIPADRRYSWSEDAGLELVATPTGKGNGMAIDGEGRVVICESGFNRVVRLEGDGSEVVLAERFGGAALNSPNDVIVARNGDIYFTDPTYGRIPVYGEERAAELDFTGVFRIPASGGGLELLATECEQPNGLVLSPDESRLYVDDCENGTIWRFELEDRRVVERGIWLADAGAALPFARAASNDLLSGYVDGMGCDERGNVYVTSVGGVLAIAPDGTKLGTIELPEDVSNFTWGGERARTCSSPVARSSAGCRWRSRRQPI